MRTPLYTQDIKREINTLNWGLYFNKFLDTWRENNWSLGSYTVGTGQNKREYNPKLDWINKFIKKELGDATQITEHLARREALLNSHQSEALYFKTNAALVAGLGNSHPIENGMAWHHTLGVPYIPGSSVKGLVREWLESWLQEEAEVELNENNVSKENWQSFKDALQRIFGSRDKKQADQVGTVIFHDAIPSEPVRLKAEIMTPHYGDYYEKGEVPGDWLNPNPIPFLAVDEGQTFQFSVMPRTSQDFEDYVFVKDWLCEALESLGIGAKTATGYGQYVKTKLDDAATEKLLTGNKLTMHQYKTMNPLRLGVKTITLLTEIIDGTQTWSDSELTQLKTIIKDIESSTTFGVQARDVSKLLAKLEENKEILTH